MESLFAFKERIFKLECRIQTNINYIPFCNLVKLKNQI